MLSRILIAAALAALHNCCPPPAQSKCAYPSAPELGAPFGQCTEARDGEEDTNDAAHGTALCCCDAAGCRWTDAGM